jgi:type IV secretory pathway VirB4 component
VSTLGEHALWATFEAPGTVALWDGGYMKTYEFYGSDITAMALEQRVQRCENVSRVFKEYGARWAWWIETQNVDVTRYPVSRWPTRASALLDAERRKDIGAVGSQYEMRHYLTLAQAAPGRLTNAFANLLMSGQNDTARKKQRDEFLRSADDLVKMLRGALHVHELSDDEVATYLHSTISTKRHPIVARADEFLGETLGDQAFRRGTGLSRLGEQYISVSTLGGFPDSSSPQLLADLAKLPFEFRWSTRWMSMGHAAAKKMMVDREEKALGQVEFVKDALVKVLDRMKHKPTEEASGSRPRYDREARQLADDAGDAMTRLAARGFGHMTTVFVVWDADARRCMEKQSDLTEKLNSHGLVVRTETIEPVKPWRMSLPGNREMGRRTFPVSTRNLADLMPTSTVWRGNEYDRELAKRTGVKRPWMYTADPNPFSINTDVQGGAAHTLVFGATGQAAKSTLINHLGYQFYGWSKAQVISLSVGRSEYGPCILSGGAVYRIGDPNTPHAFQPLARVDAPGGQLEAVEWLLGCLEALGEVVTSERREALDGAVRLMAAQTNPRLRTMTELVERDLSSRAPDLARALRPYTSAGYYGHIFDGNDAANLDWRRWTMFDIGALLKMRPEATVPAIAHLMNLVRSRFDGRPTLLYLDEVPDWVGNKQLERLVIKVVDTDRKNNVRALLTAQTPGQLMKFPDLMASIKSGCATKIYGPDGEARTQMAAYAELGVSEPEVEAIAEMSIGSYLLRNRYGSRIFDLKPGPIALALTGLSSPQELALLAELHERCSDTDELLMELLKARGLSAEAMRLDVWRTAAAKKKVA